MTKKGIPARWLLGALLALFAFDNLLLPAFLSVPIPAMVALAIPVAASIAWLLGRDGKAEWHIPGRRLAICLGIALVLFLLGGEGRLFYANPDWQVRDALLADLARNPWPYAYDIDGWTAILRAPLGLYLLPALGGEDSRELLMLASNTLRVGIMLALAGQLLDSARSRAIAVMVFLAFSGLDALGKLVIAASGLPQIWDHLEGWNIGLQYSSTVTLAFWVPNHAIAGWACALAYLLWLRRLAPVGFFAATIPLIALWSPLSAMGAVPFACHAALRSLRERDFDWRDVALAILATLVSLPSLWFVKLDAATVGGGLLLLPWSAYLMVLIFEVAPLTLPLLLYKRLHESELAAILIATTTLLVLPWTQIGAGTDAQMRCSIPALAVLAFLFGEWVGGLFASDAERTPGRRKCIGVALAILLVGAVTPAFEVKRALANAPSPVPRCSLAEVYTKQTLAIGAYGLYFASRDSLPRALVDISVTERKDASKACWDKPWDPIKVAKD